MKPQSCNIKVLQLPKNAAGKIQPFDKDILSALKQILSTAKVPPQLMPAVGWLKTQAIEISSGELKTTIIYRFLEK